tara:strand:+ start:148 stop:315 length:168 start_codon:yes stop_codon:yes gene_type:complete
VVAVEQMSLHVHQKTPERLVDQVVVDLQQDQHQKLVDQEQLVKETLVVRVMVNQE